MKLKCSFESVDMGSEFVSVPVGNGADKVGGVIKLNSSAKEIFELISDGMDEQNIVRTLAEKYENDSDELSAFVKSIFDELKNAGIFEESSIEG